MKSRHHETIAFLGIIGLILLASLLSVKQAEGFSSGNDLQLLTPTVMPTSQPTWTQLPYCNNDGDVNDDGEVTSADAQLVFQIALGYISPNPAQACAADCTGDEEITSMDAQYTFLTALGGASCADPID